MQSFLAKCAAVGIVAGGFAVTGDLARLTDRSRQLINATSVPSDGPSAHESAPAPTTGLAALPPTAPAAPATPPQTAAQAAPATGAGPATATKTWRLPGDAPADAPVGRPVAIPQPASGGVEAVELRRLSAGTRLLVWVPQPGAAGRGANSADVLALDIIDPAAGEALEHRHAAVTAGGRAPIHAPPRRVLIAADGAGRLVRGDTLRLAPLRGVNGTGRHEDFGRVLALEVKSP